MTGRFLAAVCVWLMGLSIAMEVRDVMAAWQASFVHMHMCIIVIL